jgi:hypothetical protein
MVFLNEYSYIVAQFGLINLYKCIAWEVDKSWRIVQVGDIYPGKPTNSHGDLDFKGDYITFLGANNLIHTKNKVRFREATELESQEYLIKKEIGLL